MIFIIYLATSPSGKQYIGKTSDLIKRKREHILQAKYGNKNPFYNAIRKYKNEIVFEELCCTKNETDAFKLESYFIDLFHTYAPNGYNCTLGGQGQSGRTGKRHPLFGKTGFWQDKKRPDIAKMIRERDKGKVLSQEVKLKISLSMRGKGHPQSKHLKTEIIDQFGNRYPSQYEASKLLQISCSGINEQLKGKRNRVGKYIFRYAGVEHVE